MKHITIPIFIPEIACPFQCLYCNQKKISGNLKPREDSEIHSIIDLELEKLYNRIDGLGYKLTLSKSAKDFIVDNGYDEKFGARPLKRAIQKHVEDPLAEEIIKSNLKEGDCINMDLNKEKNALLVVIKKKKNKQASDS